jgi:hypothetical protein
MKRMLILLALGVILTTATAAFADIARPKPEPSKPVEPKAVVHTNIEIVPDTKTSGGARLQLSDSTVRELRDALNAGTTAQSFAQRVAHSPTNTIVAGVLLFMSVSFAGLWLVRSSNSPNSRGQKLVAVALIGIATFSAAAIITQANAGPPPSHFWRNLTKNLNAGKPTNGSVVIEIVPDSVGTKLIVPVPKPANTDD